MVPPMEELCGPVTEWRDILLGKGLDVNASKIYSNGWLQSSRVVL